MRLTILPICLCMLMWVSPAFSDSYNLAINTNANQEAVLGILYTNDCRDALAASQPPLAGCTAECVCSPILAEKSAYLLSKLVAWFTESRSQLLRDRAREIALKYPTLNATQRGQVDNAAGIPPLQ